MKIRYKLTLQFTSIFALILVLFSLVIYYFTSLYRQDDFYKRIHKRAYITAKHLLEKDEVSAQVRNKNQISYYQVLPHEAVRVYKANGELLFAEGKGDLGIDQELLSRIKKSKELEYEQGVRQVVGIYYPDNQGDYYVLASSIDAYSLRKLQNLKIILIIGFLGSMVVVVMAGWVFAKQAMLPITKVVSEVEKISASDLHLRLSNAEGKDEISHLAQTFNKMLNRLELAFEMQSTFVSNASHELRTPLTAMIGELEVALMKKRESEEYERVLQSTLEDAKLLAELSNGLLQIAQASIDASKVKQAYLRFDELIWMALDQALKRQPNGRIDINFANFPDDENRLMIRGNEALLMIAIVNVFENAIKFSLKGAVVTGVIEVTQQDVLLEVKDRGLGIADTDINRVFIPFFRAENVRSISGHGIGLPLTERILRLHKGNIEVKSKINEGTAVTIKLPQAFAFVTAKSQF